MPTPRGEAMAAGGPLGTLVPVGGGDPIPLVRDRLTVGRRPTSDICLQFADVSGRHCEFRFRDGRWTVSDLGSSNGVKVDGVRIRGPKLLPPGAVVGIASHRYRLEYTPPAEAEFAPDDDMFGKPLLEKAGLVRPPRPKADDSASHLI